MINRIKNKFREIIILLKTNVLFYILSFLILSAFMVIIGAVSGLQIETHFKGKEIKKIYNGKKFYTIVDSFYKPEEFLEYRQSPDNINKIGDFYNSLSNSSGFIFLSAFSQPIPIENFSGDDKFLYNSEEFQNKHKNFPMNVKSLQLNQSAFEFYKLKITKGNGFKWDNINYDSGKIPVLLGSNYEGVYEIGDTFIGNYYSKDFKFIVKGFIEPNSFIYYKGNPEFYIDEYVLIPYPKKIKPVVDSDFKFEGILYFAMINGDLSSNSSKDELLNEIKEISNKTNFSNFSIVGLPELALKYSEMVSVINKNKTFLYISIILLLILIIFIQNGIARIILIRRKDLYKTYRLIGYSSVRKIYMRDISIPYFLSFIFANIIVMIGFQKISLLSVLITLVITLFIFTTSYLSCKSLFSKTTEKVI